MLDDECEDETMDKNRTTDFSEDEGASSETDSDEDEDTNDQVMNSDGGKKPSDVQNNSLLNKSMKKSKKVTSQEVAQALVAEREAEAAANNLTLLPDDPPDRLINVVGQAMRHGKTVVYAVMRTAARQPNGELIPVGGLGGTSSNSNVHVLQPLTSIESLINKSTDRKSVV